MKTTRTPLLSLLHRAYQLAATSHNTAIPADELLDQYDDSQSRRAFLRQSGQLALVAGGVGALAGCRTGIEDITPNIPPRSERAGANAPGVAIVGAGIAGLYAAHVLAKGGFTNFTIYEGANRTGGRMFTDYSLKATAQPTELGGEFIDSSHADILSLAQEFGLPLLDTLAPSELALSQYAFYFNGRSYTMLDAVREFRRIVPAIRRTAKALPDTIDYRTANADVRTLDNTSITQYLRDIGATGWLRELLDVAYETEFGLSCGQQSALNLITLIDTKLSDKDLALFGDSDERYKIAGGNQQITNKLTERYQSRIETGRVLRAVSRQNGTYRLSFDGGASAQADYVLLTIPFTVLRTVDLSDLPLSAVKRQAIRTLGYGTNAKLLMGFTGRRWRDLGYTGYGFSDNGLQTGWDNSQLQPGTAGNYTFFAGGQRGLSLGNGTPEQQAAQYVPRLNQVFPGTAVQFTGQAARMHWPSYPFTLGSYACYRVGQWTSIGGAEGEPVGRVLFAGEHCSSDFQGYMNGGAETGRVAAERLLKLVMS